jgi:hypothetical protein
VAVQIERRATKQPSRILSPPSSGSVVARDPHSGADDVPGAAASADACSAPRGERTCRVGAAEAPTRRDALGLTR